MSRALIELAGEDVLCSLVGGGSELRLPYAAAADRLAAWSARYDAAAARDGEADLLAIGQEMFAWLDDSDWASGWAAEAGDRDLEIRVRLRGDDREIALLDAPWELLARNSGPLGLDEVKLFTMARRILILRVAGGAQTKSDEADFGAAEFAPWQIGATV